MRCWTSNPCVGDSQRRSAASRLVHAARLLDDSGLNVNASGNLSIRVDRQVLVTPSGMAPAEFDDDDCVLLEHDGTVVHGLRTPTSEWRIHAQVMQRRPDVEAIVHTHSPEATAAATLHQSIPAVHYLVARFGGPSLPCAAYATYGSAALADNVVTALGQHRTACLMASHGAIAVGGDLVTAVALARDVEWFCGVYRRALALGEPVILADEEVSRVAQKFRSYGQD